MNQPGFSAPNLRRRTVLGLLAAGAGLLPRLAHADPWAVEPAARGPVWGATLDSGVAVRAQPSARAERLALVRAGTVMRVIDAQDGWAQVYDPHADRTAYVRQDLLSPAEAPSMFAYLTPPPLDTQLSTVAIATDDDTPIYFFPSLDPSAQAGTIEAGHRESNVGTLAADDGSTWLQTDDGYFLPSDGVFVASATDDFSGRWLDVTLSGAAHVVALDAGDSVRSFFAIKGTARYPTPLGAWSIVRRVANETMDSTTVGIPRNGPGGYYLQNVLYTQYFRGTGESLHYNWWSSAWGTPGSHGCLGLSLGDARWLWDWARIGTPVLIHA